LSIKGKIKIVENQDYKNDDNIQTINNVESNSLSEIIKPALKISDNLVFDSIYLSLISAYSDKKIENWSQGDEIIKSLAKKHLEIDTNNALFVDGSGLSRYNRIQPQTLFAFLKKGFYVAEFIDAFPSPNEENSTLKNRVLLPSDISAKTGNMSGISCLCGYKINKKNPKVFVFVSNSFAPPSKDMHDIIDGFISKNLSK
jgi:D-alanyl-D-alanine carboxypeptidase/D-alanyl-D-alanine-endopeptidase (penicillin-binding protein 4)